MSSAPCRFPPRPCVTTIVGIGLSMEKIIFIRLRKFSIFAFSQQVCHEDKNGMSRFEIQSFNI
jgi:hypothetical protein